MRIHIPTGEGPFAAIIFQHGFVLRYQLYERLLDHLASHGFVVVAPTMYDTGGLPFGTPSVAEEAQTAAQLSAWVQEQLEPLAGVPVDMDSLGIAGHSRGGKVAWTLALAESTFAAIAGVDPVDGTGGSPGMDGNEPRLIDGSFDLGVPTFILGTGLGPQGGALSCSPEGDNYVQFWEASAAPAWKVVATEYGHMDMLDRAACGLVCGFCQTGPDIEAMTDASAGMLVAFFRASLQGDETAYGLLEDPRSAPIAVEVESK